MTTFLLTRVEFGLEHFPLVPSGRSPSNEQGRPQLDERRLVNKTEREALIDLDEDGLLELHSRVRRARTKYVKNYRRAASPRVVEDAARGVAYPRNQRDRDKAAVFELALARVSRRVEVMGQKSRGRASGPAARSGSCRESHLPRLDHHIRCTASRRGRPSPQTSSNEDHWGPKARRINPGNGRSSSGEAGQSLTLCPLARSQAAAHQAREWRQQQQCALSLSKRAPFDRLRAHIELQLL
jgi:hypothetical protein